MPIVADILDYLETLAPTAMKMDWDNVGLLCGEREQPVHKILVALDPFDEACLEAGSIGADLIVTHHPLIFRPIKSVTSDTPVGRTIMMLCRSGISAINAHTNLDCAPEGVNHRLAQRLGLTDIRVIDPLGTDDQGRPWGLLRQGMTEEQPLSQFLSTVKERLGCEGLRYVDGQRPVRKVAVGGGACASELQTVIRSGCDTFVTADVKYNDFWDAYTAGLNLIDAGHFQTEDPIVEVLAEKLRQAFPDTEVVISQNHKDCIHFL